MPRDPVQAQRALAKAHWARSQRAELKRQLRAGRVDPIELLRGNDPEWEPVVREMRLDRILPALPGVGELTTAEACVALRLPPSTRLMGLTFEMRGRLADMMRAALAHDGSLPVPGP